MKAQTTISRGTAAGNGKTKQKERVMNTSTNKIRMVIVLAAGIFGMSVLAVRATPNFSVNFNNGTPGSPPPTSLALAGGTSTNATAAYTSSPGSILIQNTYTDPTSGFVFGNGNVAVLQHTNSSSFYNVLEFNGASSDAERGNVLMSWDMMATSGSVGYGGFYARTTNFSIMGAAVFAWSGYAYLDQIDGNGNYVSLPLIGTFALGTNVHFDYKLDYTTGLQSLYKNGALMGSTGFNTNAAFGGIQIQMQPANTATLALDNFNIVPEPTTLGLLGMGGWMLLWRLRRR